MSNVEQKKSNKSASIIIVILIILIVVVGAIIYFSLNDIRNVTFTEDNIDKTMDRISTEMHDTDDIYYLGYSMFYYMAKDGISSALIGNDVESAMYENIYGKKVKDLINEGKELMKENDVTIDEFKQQMNNMGNL